MNTDIRSLPWVTVAISAAALGLSLYPDNLLLLCFDRSAITELQQWWRFVTGHLVHSSSSHLGWDLLAFSVFSGLAELWNRKALLTSLGLALLILNGLLFSSLGLDRYAGLSGILCAPAVLALWAHFKQHPGLIHLLPALAAVAKLILESNNMEPLLSQQSWPLYAPAHWAGVVAGLLVLVLLMSPGFLSKRLNASSKFLNSNR